jgi:hypothetical protein
MGPYPPTDGHAKPFYCLTFGLNMKFSQVCWKIFNIAMNIQKMAIKVTIQNILND